MSDTSLKVLSFLLLGIYPIAILSILWWSSWWISVFLLGNALRRVLSLLFGYLPRHVLLAHGKQLTQIAVGLSKMMYHCVVYVGAPLFIVNFLLFVGEKIVGRGFSWCVILFVTVLVCDLDMFIFWRSIITQTIYVSLEFIRIFGTIFMLELFFPYWIAERYTDPE